MRNEINDFGKYLINLCDQRGMSIERLAEEMNLGGVTPLFMNDVVRSRRLPFTKKQTDRIVSVLGLTNEETEKFNDLVEKERPLYLPAGG
jgi:transcriptional regulator with XRE-family HTH domain